MRTAPNRAVTVKERLPEAPNIPVRALGEQSADLFADETVRDAGQVNPRDNFAYVFDPKFEELEMNRMDRNNDQVVKFLEDPQLSSFITNRFRNQVYDRIQAGMKSRILQT